MKNKWLNAGMVIALASPTVAFAGLSMTGCAPKDNHSEAYLVDMNDFHGACEGYGEYGEEQTDYPLTIAGQNPGIVRIANEINEFKKEHPNTVLLSAGDNNSGDAFSTSLHGESTFNILRELGVRYSAVGNHAFEWGLTYLMPQVEDSFDQWGRTEETEGNYFVAANILYGSSWQTEDWRYDESKPLEYDRCYKMWNANRVQWADPYKIININGHDICIIGLTTDKTLTDGKLDVVKEFSFIDYIASVHYAKTFALQQLGQERFNKIESFVLLTHIESDYNIGEGYEGYDEPTGAAADLAIDIDTDIDAIISGHSHKQGCGYHYNPYLGGKKVWVGQASTSGRALLETKFVFDDNKPVGSRLEEVSMNVNDIEITGKIPTPQEDPDQKEAKQEVEDIIVDAYNHYPSTHFFKKTLLEYERWKRQVTKIFRKPLGNSTINQDIIYPPCHNRKALGHEYIWPSDPEWNPKAPHTYAVEQMGAWANYATMKGTQSLSIKAGFPVKPAIGFNNMDSFTGEFKLKEGQTNRQIVMGDIQQLQTYENNVVFGYLTIGQLWNILNYSLAGRTKFNYTSNPAYGEYSTLKINPVDGSFATIYDIPDTRYLCGPIQMWGVAFEPQEYHGDEDREWEVAYDTNADGTKVPHIWVYDPESGEEALTDPTKWKTAESWLRAEKEEQKKIPVVLSSFTYNGSNHQCTMFEPYMHTNGNVITFDFFTKDAMVQFCQETTNVNLPANVVYDTWYTE